MVQIANSCVMYVGTECEDGTESVVCMTDVLTDEPIPTIYICPF